MSESTEQMNGEAKSAAVEGAAIATLTRDKLMADLGELNGDLRQLFQQKTQVDTAIAGTKGAIIYIERKIEEIDNANAPTINMDEMMAQMGNETPGDEVGQANEGAHPLEAVTRHVRQPQNAQKQKHRRRR